MKQLSTEGQSCVFNHASPEIPLGHKGEGDRLRWRGQKRLVLCQDLVQVKMRKFPNLNLPLVRLPDGFFHILARILPVTYNHNDYEFVLCCKTLPDIQISVDMPVCNHGF